MLVYKINENQIESVSGQWGFHKVQPRVSIHGWAIVSLQVRQNLNLPQEVLNILDRYTAT